MKWIEHRKKERKRKKRREKFKSKLQEEWMLFVYMLTGLRIRKNGKLVNGHTLQQYYINIYFSLASLLCIQFSRQFTRHILLPLSCTYIAQANISNYSFILNACVILMHSNGINTDSISNSRKTKITTTL